MCPINDVLKLGPLSVDVFVQINQAIVKLLNLIGNRLYTYSFIRKLMGTEYELEL